MIEFKFSCPNCNQHIQCNDAYCGLQIICPTCKNQIVVPQAPGAIPARPAASTPPPVPVQSQTAPAQKPPPPFNTPKKSKTKLVAICAAAVLIFIGVVAYVFFSKSNEPGEIATRPAVKKSANTRKSKAAPANV